MNTQNQTNDNTGTAQPFPLATGSAAWLRGADAAYKEERFLEDPINPYKPDTKRAKDWDAGYAQWAQPNNEGQTRSSRAHQES